MKFGTIFTIFKENKIYGYQSKLNHKCPTNDNPKAIEMDGNDTFSGNKVSNQQDLSLEMK